MRNFRSDNFFCDQNSPIFLDKDLNLFSIDLLSALNADTANEFRNFETSAIPTGCGQWGQSNNRCSKSTFSALQNLHFGFWEKLKGVIKSQPKCSCWLFV